MGLVAPAIVLGFHISRTVARVIHHERKRRHLTQRLGILSIDETPSGPADQGGPDEIKVIIMNHCTDCNKVAGHFDINTASVGWDNQEIFWKQLDSGCQQEVSGSQYTYIREGLHGVCEISSFRSLFDLHSPLWRWLNDRIISFLSSADTISFGFTSSYINVARMRHECSRWSNALQRKSLRHVTFVLVPAVY